MHQHQVIHFYKYRFLYAALCALAILVLFSTLITDIGRGGKFDTGSHGTASFAYTTTPDTANAVTNAVYEMSSRSQQLAASAGTSLYGACKAVTETSANSGKAAVRVSADMAHGAGHGLAVLTRGAGHGIAFVGSIVGVGSAHAAHFAGSTFMATLRVFGDGVMVPVKAVGKVAGLGFRSHAVNAIIRPADANALPVITSPSPAQLAKLTAAQRQQLAGLQAQQIADNRALGGQVLTANQYHGGYPAKWDNAPEDSTVDNWGMYNRECVSYVAWKVYQTYGAMPYWGGVGNANEWLHDAAVSGIPTGATPKVHSVAVSMRGYYGHTMWVEQVKGNMILVSQYNYDLTGHYSEMWVRGDYFTYIYFH